MNDDFPYLNRVEATLYLSRQMQAELPPTTLVYLARQNPVRGPRFIVKGGASYYKKEDLDAWLLSPDSFRFRQRSPIRGFVSAAQ